jgi:alanine transaminase
MTLYCTENLSLNSIRESVVAAEYAVRGELVMHAEKLSKQLAQQVLHKLLSLPLLLFILLPHTIPQKATGVRTLPFDEIVYCNIGNPQSLGQKPLTYFRQVCCVRTGCVFVRANPFLLPCSICLWFSTLS